MTRSPGRVDDGRAILGAVVAVAHDPTRVERGRAARGRGRGRPTCAAAARRPTGRVAYRTRGSHAHRSEHRERCCEAVGGSRAGGSPAEDRGSASLATRCDGTRSRGSAPRAAGCRAYATDLEPRDGSPAARFVRWRRRWRVSRQRSGARASQVRRPPVSRPDLRVELTRPPRRLRAATPLTTRGPTSEGALLRTAQGSRRRNSQRETPDCLVRSGRRASLALTPDVCRRLVGAEALYGWVTNLSRRSGLEEALPSRERFHSVSTPKQHHVRERNRGGRRRRQQPDEIRADCARIDHHEADRSVRPIDQSGRHKRLVVKRGGVWRTMLFQNTMVVATP